MLLKNIGNDIKIIENMYLYPSYYYFRDNSKLIKNFPSQINSGESIQIINNRLRNHKSYNL